MISRSIHKAQNQRSPDTEKLSIEVLKSHNNVVVQAVTLPISSRLLMSFLSTVASAASKHHVFHKYVLDYDQ